MALASTSAAEEVDGSLESCLREASLNNRGLQAAYYHWQAAAEKAVGADALPNPKVSFAYFLEEVETRVGPQEYKVGLAQAFPWFGTLKSRSDVAAEAAHAAYQAYEASKLDLFFEVKKAFYEYAYLHRSIEVMRSNVQLLRRLESVALTKHRAGAPQSGVLRAQVELGKLEDRLQSLEDRRGPLAARLNAAMNRPHDEPVPWPVDVEFAGGAIDEQRLFERMGNANPALNGLRAVVRQNAEAIDLARKGFFPGVVVGVDYIVTDDARMPNTADSGKDPVVAMVALDIPIWRGSLRSKVSEAEGRHRAAELKVEEQSNRLEVEMKLALFTYRDAERKVGLYGTTLVAQAEQALRLAEDAYRSGKEEFLGLIDAERLLLEFQLAHERALVDREIALAAIDKLAGGSPDMEE